MDFGSPSHSFKATLKIHSSTFNFKQPVLHVMRCVNVSCYKKCDFEKQTPGYFKAETRALKWYFRAGHSGFEHCILKLPIKDHLCRGYHIGRLVYFLFFITF